MNRRKTGWEREEQAAAYLAGQGYEILARNYRCPSAELDIVAREREYLCFVEVKYRHSNRFGGIEGTISHEKIRRICKGARFYLAEKSISPDTPVRFDVVFIVGETFSLLKNAFSYVGFS
ncbi:MAG: YraN family protein [Lachnospiraceae bacterium]|nr:YraN family protein [Lachnospiraceae bacterium]